jgi:hypothetical protein
MSSLARRASAFAEATGDRQRTTYAWLANGSSRKRWPGVSEGWCGRGTRTPTVSLPPAPQAEKERQPNHSRPRKIGVGFPGSRGRPRGTSCPCISPNAQRYLRGDGVGMKPLSRHSISDPPVHRPLTPSAPTVLTGNGVRACGALKDGGVMIGNSPFSGSSGRLRLRTRSSGWPSILASNARKADVAVGAVLGSRLQAPTTQWTGDGGHASG